ncbi:MAG: hypothetical protein ACRD2L_10300, partial [Terriglobia bacterium]
GDSSRYVIRHPAIAELILSNANREKLARAHIDFLRTISSVLPSDRRERRLSRAFRVFRDTCNHKRLRAMFPNRLDLVRNIYEEMKDYFRDDGHYWLQYGTFELEYGGQLDAAENYIQQAAALMPGNKQVSTAYAYLLMKKAVAATTSGAAQSSMQEAVAILSEEMSTRNDVQGYPYHVYGSQMISYIRKWVRPAERSSEFRRVHDELQKLMPLGLKTRADMAQLLKDLKRAELESVVTG